MLVKIIKFENERKLEETKLVESSNLYQIYKFASMLRSLYNGKFRIRQLSFDFTEVVVREYKIVHSFHNYQGVLNSHTRNHNVLI